MSNVSNVAGARGTFYTEERETHTQNSRCVAAALHIPTPRAAVSMNPIDMSETPVTRGCGTGRQPDVSPCTTSAVGAPAR